MQDERKQKTSKFLSLEQNQLVLSLLGPKSKSRAIGIVRAHRSKPPTHSEWQVWCCGVASFTKDPTRKSYYIQIFDIDKRLKMFEQPVNQDLEYRANYTILHQFDAETYVVGLEFAIEEEALKFKAVLEKRLKKMVQKDREMAKLPSPLQPTTEKLASIPDEAVSPASPSFGSPNPPIAASHPQILSKQPAPVWKKPDITVNSSPHPGMQLLNKIQQQKAGVASRESEGSKPYPPVSLKPNLRLGSSNATSLTKAPSQSSLASKPTLPQNTSKPDMTKPAPSTTPSKPKQIPHANDRPSDDASSRNFLLDQIKNPPQKLRPVNLEKTLNNHKQNNSFVTSSGAHPIFKDLSKVLDARGKACRGLSMSDVSASSSDSDDGW